MVGTSVLCSPPPWLLEADRFEDLGRRAAAPSTERASGPGKTMWSFSFAFSVIIHALVRQRCSVYLTIVRVHVGVLLRMRPSTHLET